MISKNSKGKDLNKNLGKSQRYTAMTLAEVLITLGSIGIVTIMTIPILTNVAQDLQQKTSLKKAYSIITQVYTSLKNDNGGTIAGSCEINDSTCLTNLFKPYLKYNFEYSGIPSVTNLPGCWNNSEMIMTTEQKICLGLNDGIIMVFDMEYKNCNNTTLRCGYISVDTNGLKSPNVYGKDRYLFVIWENSIKPDNRPCNYGIGDWTSNLGCAYTYLQQ